jgi:hypothetical protein
MRTSGLKRAVRNALFRLGLHTTPKGIVDALAQQGVQRGYSPIQTSKATGTTAAACTWASRTN